MWGVGLLAAQVGEHGEYTSIVVWRLGEVQLLEDAADVALDGLLAQEQSLGDGPIGPTFGDQRENVALAGGQFAERRRRAGLADEPGDDRRVDDALAGADASDRI